MAPLVANSEKWIAEFLYTLALDVKHHPEAYKESVRDNVYRAGMRIVDGLSVNEIRQLTRELKSEMRRTETAMTKRNPIPKRKRSLFPKRKRSLFSVFKKRPKQQRYFIVGFDDHNKRYYFTGTGFVTDGSERLMFKNSDLAEARGRKLIKERRLPSKIVRIGFGSEMSTDDRVINRRVHTTRH